MLSFWMISLRAAELPATGTNITADNVAQYANYLDQPMIELIKKGDVTIEVGASFSIPPNSEFQKQTEINQGLTKIDPGTGNLSNYHGGIPFADAPDKADELAGVKLAWNMRYSYGGEASSVEPFIWDYINMQKEKVERTLSFVGKTFRYKHRIMLDPRPEVVKNPGNLFSALYLRAKEPFDLTNTQLLVHRPEDDSSRDGTWLYLATQRRVRRLPSGQNTDAFLGSDFMIEDFLGYNGRIKDMNWRYLETRELLEPFFRYDQITLEEKQATPDGFKFGLFHGQGGCFPNVPWQVRKVYVLEAVPTWKDHPLSKRIFFVDAETFIPVAGRYYDRSKKIWRIAIAAFAHPDHHLEHNKGSGVAIPSLISMIDVQARHCTTLKMKTLINDGSVKQSDFTVQSLRKKGR